MGDRRKYPLNWVVAVCQVAIASYGTVLRRVGVLPPEVTLRQCEERIAMSL